MLQIIPFINRNNNPRNSPHWRWRNLFRGFLLDIHSGGSPWCGTWSKTQISSPFVNLVTLQSWVRGKLHLWMNSRFYFLSNISPFLHSFLFLSSYFGDWLQEGYVPPEAGRCVVGCTPPGARMGRSWVAQLMLWVSSSFEGPWSSLASATTPWDSTSVWPQCPQWPWPECQPLRH